MQNVYKNYDQMINEIEFKDGILKLIGKNQIDLDYVKFI